MANLLNTMRRLYSLLLIILVIALASCGSANMGSPDHFDSVSFEYYKNIENSDAELHLPTNILESLAIEYTEGSDTSANEAWTINYDFKYEYLLYDYVDDELLSDLYKSLLASKDDINQLVGFEFDLYEDCYISEAEYTLSNPNKDLIGYIIANIYLPVLVYESGSYHTISIPLKTIVLMKSDTHVSDINGNLDITWEKFKANPILILE